ncbi:MAG: DUF1223 domain-containing protein, partial [Pseudomonadota bacterium]
FASLAFAAAALSAVAAAADDAHPVVVELFTSQGCSSCPPADATLGELAKRDDVVALSLHVDYWDYLGWRDIFGSAAHTQRQRNYAAMMRERSVYTPQMVIQGSEHVVGSRKAALEEAIERQAAAPRGASVALTILNGQLVAEIAPLDAPARARGQVLLAWYSDSETVKIQRGENGGRDIRYHNVVKGWSDLGVWRGGRIALTAPKPMNADGVAVLVQEIDGGPILGAAKLRLKEAGG